MVHEDPPAIGVMVQQQNWKVNNDIIYLFNKKTLLPNIGNQTN
jgi:hypothetical protein